MIKAETEALKLISSTISGSIKSYKETKTDINGIFSFDFSVDHCDSIKVSYRGYLPGVIRIRELIEKFTEDRIN